MTSKDSQSARDELAVMAVEAAEATVMILRIDDVIASKSGPGGAGGLPGGMPGGMGGEDFE